jgi:hypothetical protein
MLTASHSNSSTGRQILLPGFFLTEPFALLFVTIQYRNDMKCNHTVLRLYFFMLCCLLCGKAQAQECGLMKDSLPGLPRQLIVVPEEKIWSRFFSGAGAIRLKLSHAIGSDDYYLSAIVVTGDQRRAYINDVVTIGFADGTTLVLQNAKASNAVYDAAGAGLITADLWLLAFHCKLSAEALQQLHSKQVKSMRFTSFRYPPDYEQLSAREKKQLRKLAAKETYHYKNLTAKSRKKLQRMAACMMQAER